ncbi:MAG: hypothetical protein LBJ63_06635 [Prevotellaceae bacterium]|jgi:hypothetical protein|nr:hypothetical protein [Prevotellaceae bacterium]
MSGIAKADGYEYAISGYGNCGEPYNNTIHSPYPLTEFQIDYLHMLAKTQIPCSPSFGSFDGKAYLEYCCDEIPEQACPYNCCEGLEIITCYKNGTYHTYIYCNGSPADDPCDYSTEGSDDEYEGSGN